MFLEKSQFEFTKSGNTDSASTQNKRNTCFWKLLEHIKRAVALLTTPIYQLPNELQVSETLKEFHQAFSHGCEAEMLLEPSQPMKAGTQL